MPQDFPASRQPDAPIPAISLAEGGLQVTRLSDTPNALGESPVWDGQNVCLWWIDGVAGQIWCRPWRDGAWGASQSADLGEHVGSIALADDGGLVVALEQDIIHWHPVTRERRVLWAGANTDARVRLNDGKNDRQGRFLVAGMGRDGESLGRLLQLGADGQQRELATGLITGNGLCVSPAGDRLYYTDTRSRQMMVCEYDPATGAAGAPQVLFDTDALVSGIDGATVDADGNLWVALVRGGEFACFSAGGELLRRFQAPVDLPTSLAFGGPEGDILFLTSIRDSGSGRAVSQHPNGGHLFAIEGLGVTGILEAAFSLPD